MPRSVRPKIDALFVEGPDDGVVVNALVERHLAIDIVRPRLVRLDEKGGGFEWALTEFERLVRERQHGARIGAIVDRDDDTRWNAVKAALARLGCDVGEASSDGVVFDGFGVWMWPNNLVQGDLESFLEGILPASPTLNFARDASTTAREQHAAEYEARHHRKATFKVRSVWHDATTAGGYGHIVRALTLTETDASRAFLGWFTRLFLQD